MGHNYNGGAHAVNFLKEHHQLQRTGGIQIARGLVGHDDAGVVHQRPGHGHPLLLAAGKLRGQAAGLVQDAYQIQHIGDPLFDRALGRAHSPHDEGHIFIDGLIFDQAEILKNHADGAAQVGDVPLTDAPDIIVAHLDLAGGGAELGGKHFDDGGFAAAGGADDKNELSVLNGQRDAPQRFGSVVVGFEYILQLDHSVLLCQLMTKCLQIGYK